MKPRVSRKRNHGRSLINLPVPLPSIPVLTPLLNPIIGGTSKGNGNGNGSGNGNGNGGQNGNPNTSPAQAPTPTTDPSPPPSTQQPSGGNNGGNGGSSGGSSESSSGSSGQGNQGGSSSTSENAGSTGNIGGSSSGSDGTGSSSNGQGNSVSTPSNTGSSTTGSSNGVANVGSPNDPSGNSGQGGVASSPQVQDALSSGTGTADPSVPTTGSSGSSSGSGGSESSSISGQPANHFGGSTTTPTSGLAPNGGQPNIDPTVSGNTSGSSKSGVSGGAVAGIVIGLLTLCALVGVIFLRRRHKRRQKEREIRWLGGVSGGPEMDQRKSVRSSWGTPVERITSWDRLSDDVFFAYTSPAANHTDSSAPVLPMPAHSPPDFHPSLTDDPFADYRAPSPQPIKEMASLPIRVSLISAGSSDPFADPNTHELEVEHDYVLNHDHDIKQELEGNSASSSHVNFPMPPATPSVKSVFAIGSPSDLDLNQLLPPSKGTSLLTPTISFTFPDSPISPTFASQGTASYPRRASVKHPFKPSDERRDEVHLEQGDEVNVVSVYEDGWAFIEREKDRERGLAPLNCLDLDANSL